MVCRSGGRGGLDVIRGSSPNMGFDWRETGQWGERFKGLLWGVQSDALTYRGHPYMFFKCCSKTKLIKCRQKNMTSDTIYYYVYFF